MVVSTVAPVIGPTMAQGDGKVLRIAMQQDMPNFNYFDLNSNSVWKDYVIGKWCFEGLSGLDPGGNIFPAMAEEWTFDSSDETNLTVEIKIREGVTFHDGETMDADDIIFSFSSLRDGTTYSSNIIDAFDSDGDGSCSADEIDGTIDADGDGSFEGITKDDQYNVTMIMGKPYGQFFLMTLGVPIIPEHVWSSHLTAEGIVDVLWNTDPAAAIGTGPMKYHSGEDDVFRRVVAFEDYWGVNEKTPSEHWMFPQEVSEIYFTLYASLDTAILALKSGKVDHIPWTVTPGYVPDLIQNPNTDIESVSDNGYFYLAFNMKREPMNHLAFRKAVSHTIDKETIVERYMGGYGQAGDSSEPPFWADWYNSSVKIYPFNLAEAESALAAGGFTGIGSTLKMPDGRPVPPLVLLTPPADYDPVRIKAGELIAKNLRSLGMDIVASPVDFDTLVAKMNAFDYDMLIIGWSLSSDPVGNVFDILGPMASQNYFAWWPVDHEYENPWYNELGGVSTMADSQSQQMAIRCHELGQMAKESFDRNEQIFYTKWGQGLVSEALPCNVLYYRVNNYAISNAWSGWIAYFGELLNVYSLGALTSEVTEPEITEVNVVLNVPEKLPLMMNASANVVVFDEEGKPIEDADVTLEGDDVMFYDATGKTDEDGTFMFNVKGMKHAYVTLDVTASKDGTEAELSRTIQTVAGIPPMAFLQVMPDDLFLGAGESTAVNLKVMDGAADPMEGVTVELDEGLMGYGTVDNAEVTTDAMGEATITYTAPSELPMNKHIEVRLSLSTMAEGDIIQQNVNTVTQFLVLYNDADSDWHFVQVKDVSKIACNESNATTTITVEAMDEEGNPLAEEIAISYSNEVALVDPERTVTTNATGDAQLMVNWDNTSDTNSTQVWFQNVKVPNSVGAGVNLLYKGNTTKDLYGGYFTIMDTPMLDPDSEGNLTWDVWVKDLDDENATVPVSFIVGEPADGSTAAMVDAPDHIWSSLWDYAGINIFLDSDDSVMATSGYLLSNRMSDSEVADIGGNNFFGSWQDYYDIWAPAGPGGQGPDELENLTAVEVTDGHWQVQVERDSVVLSDNIPSLLVVPMGKAGFYATPDFANFWWQLEGMTAWKTEFVMQRTDTVYSVGYDMGTGVLRPFAPGNTSSVGLWAYDQDGNAVQGVDVGAWVQVYGASPFFDVSSAAATDATGGTSATVTGLTEDGGGNPLSNPVKQPLYMEVKPEYGWTVFTSVEIFNLPIQLYLSIETTPIIQEEGETVTQSEVMVTVVDENGEAQADTNVTFSYEGGSISSEEETTDGDGHAMVTYTMPEILEDEEFTFGSVGSSVSIVGYGAASSLAVLISYTPEILYPPELTIDFEEGTETCATTILMEGTVTDVQGVDKVEVSLDEGDYMEATIDNEAWSYQLTGLTVGDHCVTVMATNVVALTASVMRNFTILEPPAENEPPVVSMVKPTEGTKTKDTFMVVECEVTDDYGIASVKVSLNDGVAKVMAAGENDTYSYNFTGLEVGTYDVLINATDDQGLFTTATTSFEIEEKEPTDGEEETDYTWLYIVIIIIIILIIIAVVMMSRGGGEAPAPEPEPEPEPMAEPGPMAEEPPEEP